MEGTERIVLENLCMLRDGSKVLVEDKITEDLRGRRVLGIVPVRRRRLEACAEIG